MDFFILFFSDAELHEMLDKADIDRDGFVNAEEFYGIITKVNVS